MCYFSICEYIQIQDPPSMKISTILIALTVSLLFATGGANAATGAPWMLPEINSNDSTTGHSGFILAQTKPEPKPEEEEEEELGEDDC